MASKTSACCCSSEDARTFRPDGHLPAPSEIQDRLTNTNVDTGMQAKNLSHDHATTSLPPIHRIPNELLSNFFLSCLSSSSSSIPFLNLHTDTLWSILQVCRFWRNVAFSTPRLWCTLLIDLAPLKSPPPPHYTHLHTRLLTCLSHSGPNVPLSFALIGGTQSGHHDFILPLLTSLCTFSHRWSTVYFSPYITNILSSSKQLAPLGLGRRFNFRHLSLSTPNLTPLGLLPHSVSPGFGFTQIPDSTQFTSTPHVVNLTAIEEQCHPCTCATIKRRMLNGWAETLKKSSTPDDVQITLTYTPSPPPSSTSTDNELIHFLFSNLD
ncbi:hypothetical protein P691DRAFT_788910 [Macrolepiota fuliginosa MF-IS2]|uniref:F-box domain-containing protein n=1 Tax=Macrolepiota fuliginosa MF-IS2 TaxID=1400762 RepID=A0A9P5XGM6_9AGAR|nr:hypothetical protein P691DRAFT_788910 [Macrolepiota fuliginosa MF-IS2]